MTTASRKTKYLHYDHIGSLDAATDEAGQVIERLSYDPHGKRRQSNWCDASGLITSQVITHGFTGHEHLDSVGLRPPHRPSGVSIRGTSGRTSDVPWPRRSSAARPRCWAVGSSPMGP